VPAACGADALSTETLRPLTVDPQAHPRGLGHVAAASGLVCAWGRAYVVCDDEHHLAVFHDTHTPGRLHRLLPGDLPLDKTERKRRKADFEALLLLDSRTLLAFGSGSAENRDTAVVLTLDAHGDPAGEARRFDLAPLYQPLRAALGDINIEGAFLLGSDLVLLHRGGQGGSRNAFVRFDRAQLLAAIEGRAVAAWPRIHSLDLGALDGVPLGFTDGAALSNGAWVFSAAAEDTADSYADGPCAGGAVGLVNAAGELQLLRRLATLHKPEGIAAREQPGGVELCLVTDADDPARCAELLRAVIRT
jgi:hypothetical protein